MSSSRSRQSSPLLNHHELMVILEQKDRDLELAAKIGQSLLEQNRDLQTKNEFLEESVNKNHDTIVQLKHELNQRIELLRVYSNLDDDGFPRSNSDETLRERLKSTKTENERLRQECDTLRQESLHFASAKRSTIELTKHLNDANEKVIGLQKQIEQKSGELQAQFERTGQLVKELADKEKKEKMITMEKDEMGGILIEMIQKHDTMHLELKDMQDQYAELLATCSESEAELARMRQTASLRMSFDSLYDSLASEMESSDQNASILSPIARKYDNKDSGIENNMSLAAEIEMSEKEESMETPKTVAHPIHVLCDASTSCTDIFVKTEELCLDDSILPSSSTASISEEPEYLDDKPSFQEVETSTPIVARRYTSSPTKTTNLHKLQRLHATGVLRPTTPLSPLRSKCVTPIESSSSSSNYNEPKLGQPGIPGTRDLDVSLKIIKAREEVQKEFAAYCQRKGIASNDFYSSENSRRRDSNWTDFSVSYGVRMIQSLLPRRSDQTLALTNKQGVLTRAELMQSPTTSPQHRPPQSLSLSLSAQSSFGANQPPHGVLQRR